MYQTILGDVRDKMQSGDTVPVKLFPEPENLCDASAIAFKCFHDSEWSRRFVRTFKLQSTMMLFCQSILHGLSTKLRKFYATKTGESKRSKKYIFIAIHSRVYSHVSHTQLNR